jgi:hypothetical protein
MSDKGVFGNLNITKKSIDDAKIINPIEGLHIHIGFYFSGLLLMLFFYIGPFFYYRIYKKRNFAPQSNMSVKHAI